MSAHRIAQDLYDALSVGVFSQPDPGASGVINVHTKGRVICEVTTAGAEARTLESADGLPVGTEVAVVLKSDGGDCTVSSSGDDTAVVLTDEGQIAEFVVVSTSTGNEWRSNSDAVNLPASAGTYELASTNTAADNALAILAILAALEDAGLVDASGITQAA